MSGVTWLPQEGTDSTGFTYDALAFVFEHVKGHKVCFAKNHKGIFLVASSGIEATERAVGHRGPFPTEEAALTYLRLVKD